jgi:hypothetical protein
LYATTLVLSLLIRSFAFSNLSFPPSLLWMPFAFSRRSLVMPFSLRPGNTPCICRTSSDIPLISICSCCCISLHDQRGVVLIVPVSSNVQECDLPSASASLPCTWYLVALCSKAFKTDWCEAVLRRPGCWVVVQDPSIFIKLILLHISPPF